MSNKNVPENSDSQLARQVHSSDLSCLPNLNTTNQANSNVTEAMLQNLDGKPDMPSNTGMVFQMAAVGKQYLPIIGKPEGAYFDISDSGAILIYNFSSPTKKEIDAMHEGKQFEIRFLEYHHVLWILSKCGENNWTDSPYTPHLSHLSNGLPKITVGTGLALTLMMTDARTGIVKSLRHIGLGDIFSRNLLKCVEDLRNSGWDIEEHQKNVTFTQKCFTTKELVRMAHSSYRVHGGDCHDSL